MFTVKNNQQALRNVLKALPWNEIPVSSSIGGRDHGRRERCTIKATEVAGGLGFPRAVQVLQVRRTVIRGGRRSLEVVYLVTSMPMVSAAPLQVAAWVRGHSAIENRLHWVRDVTFDEDQSGPHRHRSAVDGHDPQHHRQRPPLGRPRQHRCRATAAQPQPAPAGRPASCSLTCGYARCLGPGPWASGRVTPVSTESVGRLG